MPYFPQVATFGLVPVVGLDAVISRGPRPSVFRLRVPHSDNLDVSAVEDLTIQSNTGPVTFSGCVADLSTVRMPYPTPTCMPMTRTPGKREYVLKVRDKRQTWKKLALNGRYNYRYRDCTIKPATQKTIDEIADLMLTEAGESPSTSTGMSDAYPSCDWNNANLVEAMEALQSQVPAYICRAGDDTYYIDVTGDTEDLSAFEATTPDFAYTVERGPLTVKVLCGPTLYQQFLELEAVGREIDGQILPINSLSYTPSGGWANEHPLYFAGVDIDKRHLALKTVMRMYRVKVQQVSGSSTTISDIEQFDLDDVLVSMGGSGDDKVEIPCFIKGVFYPYTEHFQNTGTCVHWAGDIKMDRIDKETRCVEFNLPVYKAGSCIEPAELYLCTGFRVRNSSTWAFDRKEFTSDRDTGQGEQVLDHPELFETIIESYLADCTNSGSPTKNTSAIQAEADVYINAWKDHWDKMRDVRDVEYTGTLPLSLSGAIAQISYRLGRGHPPITRVSQHYEHSTSLR